jgi:nucleotide-binding universal stress UspA family protein
MYQRILAPLDGSKLGECTLDHIKYVAKGCNTAEVYLITVVEETTPPYIELGGRENIDRAIESYKKEFEKTKERAENYLEKVVENFKSDDIRVHTDLVVEKIGEGVADKILEYAQNNNIDLIIISTHGRSGISRWAFGSVADKVVRTSTVPVLTVTPTGCRIG